MRMWRNGNASPCRGEDPGPIPGIRSRGARARLAGYCAHGLDFIWLLIVNGQTISSFAQWRNQ